MQNPNMIYVYVLRCGDGTIYIGQTQDVEERLKRHRDGKVSWTMSRLPVELLRTWEFASRVEARAHEKKLKTGYGREWIKRNLF